MAGGSKLVVGKSGLTVRNQLEPKWHSSATANPPYHAQELLVVLIVRNQLEPKWHLNETVGGTHFSAKRLQLEPKWHHSANPSHHASSLTAPRDFLTCS